ncbi:MAG: membrane protein insertion efficiency factor YidD [Candidatus Binatia bacterium]
MAAFVRKGLIILLRAYHEAVSPLLPRACRFYPTCSIYFANAIEKYGVLRGGWLGLCRMTRCRPAHPGGYDPVK